MARYSEDDAEDAEAKLRAMGVQFSGGIPIFPFEPDSFKKSLFYVGTSEQPSPFSGL